MSPRRLIILTMSLCGLFAGLAGAIEILDLGYYPAVFGTTIGFAGITVGLLGRAHPVGILLAALLLGGMRAGAPAMQITAKIPIEIIDVIQGLILVFLAAEVVIRQVFRIRAERATPGELKTVAASYGSGRPDGRPVQHPDPGLDPPVHRLCHRPPPVPRAADAPAGHADRPRRAVRRDVRAEWRREHRDRGPDADGGVRRLHGRDARQPGDPERDPERDLRGDAGARDRRARRRRLGMVVSALHAWLSVSVQANQIISGTAINILALGLTGYLNRLIRPSGSAGSFDSFHPPQALIDLPLVGWIFNTFLSVGPITMSVIVFVVGLQIWLFRSRWGLRTRAVGEHPGRRTRSASNVIACATRT
jgi:ABC-type uncharacterized transport system permease subunit